MNAEIIKILPEKKSRNGGVYLRVEFRMENGKWAKTDLVPGFRNYERWKNLLRPGNIIGNLRMKDEKTVDADSIPYLIFGKMVDNSKSPSIKELVKMGVFG